MARQTFKPGSADARAVSPVIGVILMVAISVILAAVVGAFVLEVGDRPEMAPNASFESGERVVTLESDRDMNNFGGAETIEINTTQLGFRHAGGDTLSISQTEITIDGHDDVWGVSPNLAALEQADGKVSDAVDIAPQPDFRRTMGTNQEPSFGSGDSWNVVLYNVKSWAGYGGGPSEHPWVRDGLYEPGTVENSEPAVRRDADYIYIQQFESKSGWGYHAQGKTLIEIHSDESASGASYGDEQGYGEQVVRGDEMSVVWSAKSGGKTQILYKYTAKHTGTEDNTWF